MLNRRGTKKKQARGQRLTMGKLRTRRAPETAAQK
jgi:hypothetical protein